LKVNLSLTYEVEEKEGGWEKVVVGEVRKGTFTRVENREHIALNFPGNTRSPCM
jgi:hypothetical protein